MPPELTDPPPLPKLFREESMIVVKGCRPWKPNFGPGNQLFHPPRFKQKILNSQNTTEWHRKLRQNPKCDVLTLKALRLELVSGFGISSFHHPIFLPSPPEGHIPILHRTYGAKRPRVDVPESRSLLSGNTQCPCPISPVCVPRHPKPAPCESGSHFEETSKASAL